MNSALMFSKASDEWSTPQDFYDRLDAEFQFDTDVAASATNAKTEFHIGPGSIFEDALCPSVQWGTGATVWCNPPYSKCKEFVARAAQQAKEGRTTTVMLIPARTDTRYFHAHIWDADKHRPRPGVEVRFIKGRLKFGDGKNSAPFPSMVVIFRPA